MMTKALNLLSTIVVGIAIVFAVITILYGFVTLVMELDYYFSNP